MSAGLRVMRDVVDERARQDAKWGEQNHIDGTGPGVYVMLPIGVQTPAGDVAALPARRIANAARRACKANGSPESPDTWAAILLEEVFEALAEGDPVTLRTELVQVAAVAQQWVEAIDRRSGNV